jgi:3-hydroxyisobutyrate dehydrogenase-like beta-hydroxyacid dehydrogenase
MEVIAESMTLAEKAGIGAGNVHDLIKGIYLTSLALVDINFVL